MQIPKDSDNRLKAGINYILIENTFAGHTCLPFDRLMQKATELLEIDTETFERIVDEEITNINLVEYQKDDKKYIYLREYYIAESFISRRMLYMRSSLYNNHIDFDEVIDIDEKENGIKYEEHQRQAIVITSYSIHYTKLYDMPFKT